MSKQDSNNPKKYIGLKKQIALLTSQNNQKVNDARKNTDVKLNIKSQNSNTRKAGLNTVNLIRKEKTSDFIESHRSNSSLNQKQARINKNEDEMIEIINKYEEENSNIF